MSSGRQVEQHAGVCLLPCGWRLANRQHEWRKSGEAEESEGSNKTMKSALFVDFDNVFSQLRQLQPDAAERFARHPADWIGWLTGSLALPEPHEEGEGDPVA